MVEPRYRGQVLSEVVLNTHELVESGWAGSHTSTSGSKVLPLRTTMAQGIVAALKNDIISMIAICGMGGIGKTTMTQQLSKIARLECLFDDIVIIVVSQNADVMNIQNKLADQTGLRLPQRNIIARAEHLHALLTRDKRFLLILDDVWEELDMGAIGLIPIGDGCNVIFTSRDEDVCHKMGGQTFTIEPLSDEEAWNLLKEIAGKCVDSPSVYPIAREVAKNCRGLPRLIVNLGANLRNRENYDWVDALQQLRKSARTKSSGSDREVYLAIESIYDDLENVKAKSLFRLCCRFPKDEEIQIELLIRYSQGLQLFEGEKALVEARKVDMLVRELKRRNLLASAGSHEEFVEVPAVAWDVGRDKSRAQEVRNEYLLLLNGKNGLKESSENDEFDPYASISIYSNEMHELPDDYLDCAGLKHLSFQCSHDELEISRDLFEGMRDLQVMDLRINTLQPLPPSLKFLSNLRALYLDFSSLGEISLIGSLHELEILTFFKFEIGVLPSKIRQLRKLKLLDLRCKSGPKIIDAGVLSGLKQLEELYMGSYFDPRNAVEKGAKAVELNTLPFLITLQISLTLDNDSLRKFKNFKFQNPKRFDFSKFDMESILSFPRYHFSNSAVLNGVDHVSSFRQRDRVNKEIGRAYSGWCGGHEKE